MGYKDELEEFKIKYINYIQQGLDKGYNDIHMISNKTVFYPFKLTDEIESKVLEISNKHNFLRIYSVKKILKTNEEVVFVLVVIDKNSKELDYAFDDIFKMLDVEYKLFVLDFLIDPLIEKRIKKVSKPIYERKK